jgi:ApaG protein
MVTAITAGIKVTVETLFQEKQSDIKNSRFLFSYRITIENETDRTVKLRRRLWDITDACGLKHEVEGEGVVGEQPEIQPGKKYQYISGCEFKTEIGKMSGNYLMQCQLTKTFFKVNIPAFLMTVPYKLN